MFEHGAIYRCLLNIYVLVETEPPLDRHMPVLPVNVSPVPVKNIVAGTKYRLKLSVLCDLLEIILCTLDPEASGSSR